MNKGVSLVELIIAVCILAIVGISIALIFPKSFQTTINNRQRMSAVNFAGIKMEEIKSFPYALIPRTPDGAYFIVANCDCGGVDWNSLPMTATQYNNGTDLSDTMEADGITFTRKVCINLADQAPASPWAPHCPSVDENDPTLNNIRGKNIRVHVTWNVNNETKSVDVESFATRL